MKNKKEEKEKENGKSGTLSDNDYSQAQKIMKDNNLPYFYTEEKEKEEKGEEDDDNTDK